MGHLKKKDKLMEEKKVRQRGHVNNQQKRKEKDRWNGRKGKRER